MRKKIIISGISGFIIIGLLCAIGFSLNKDRDALYKDLDVFTEALAIVKTRHVDEKPIHDMIYGAMRGMLASLDAYSQFLDPDEYKDLIIDTEGVFAGIGIEITMRKEILTVISPIEDTPAWNAGIQPGDIIVKIDGQSTEGISLDEAVKKLRGDSQTAVIISVLREKTKKIEDIKIIREIIKIKDIKWARLLEDGIGYVRITEFRENTDDELDRALAKLKKKKIKGLIIDVRNNPGGLLYSAIAVTDKFLNDGLMIVSTDSRSENPQEYRAQAGQKILDIPLVVLINKGSASGSEILAAALRDNKRAVLVGETTFGKGSVQTIIPLSDGSALRLTTSKYYTPKKMSIHEKGVIPDIIIEKDIADEKKVSADTSREENDFDYENNFDYKKDRQILKALETIKSALAVSKK